MKLTSDDFLLYLVTERKWLKDDSLEDVVEKAVSSGVTFVQLREKELCASEMKSVALKVKRVTDKYNIPFVINDSLETALAVDSDGIHLGQNDMDISKVREVLPKGKIVGLSAANLEEALIAERKGADYIGVGSVFRTSTKLDARSVSLEELKEIKKRVSIPVVAIGGIDEKNIHLLKESRVDGVAVVSAVLGKSDISKAVKTLKHLSCEYLRRKK